MNSNLLKCVLAACLYAFACPATLLAKEPGSKIEAVNELLDRAGLNTPPVAYEAVLGPPISIYRQREGAPLRHIRYEDGHGIRLQIALVNEQVFSISGFDSGSNLRIPKLNMGSKSRSGEEKTYTKLSDFTVSDALYQCGGAHGSMSAGKAGNFFVGPCYFGRPGGYAQFYFIFYPQEDTSEACITMIFRAAEIEPDKLGACEHEKLSPVGFMVYKDDELPEGFDAEEAAHDALDRFIGVLNGDYD
ncbi:hypothetical protein [Rhizobium sp. L1K21]|uniref:hypothetical protein n=1 Tax=Rhizobium sp. L1K21 TaxID=2954933 RepID=UPI002092B632|nr:hypothetical protein [Rhizobium sp. L1K21]MCO6186195.1 hypothetical protein [Rhizobium sp. L1K21]